MAVSTSAVLKNGLLAGGFGDYLAMVVSTLQARRVLRSGLLSLAR